MILVLATPRSGSSWFTSNYLTTVHEGYTSIGEPFNYHKCTLEDQLTILEFATCNSVIVKLFPQHLKNNIPNLYSQLTRSAKKIYILARKDYNAQLRSLYIAEQTDYYYADNLPNRNIHFNNNHFLIVDQFLKNSYQFLSDAYANLKNVDLVFLEDLPNTGKYKQPVTWDTEPPLVNFNVEEIFKDQR